jgi:hypothetical protein
MKFEGYDKYLNLKEPADKIIIGNLTYKLFAIDGKELKDD